MKELNYVPFKGRILLSDEPIIVYRNLNRKGKVYSIKQGNWVVGHATNLVMHDCEFVVNKAGKARAIKTGQRNVHAYIKGFLNKDHPQINPDSDIFTDYRKIEYKPFTDIGFYFDCTINDQPLHLDIIKAMKCIINENGVFGIALTTAQQMKGTDEFFENISMFLKNYPTQDQVVKK
jgi:hypothetical protein